jgi:polysaccharide pyruvyl transferase WcaK-like protein
MAFDRSDRRFGDQYYHILRSVAKAAKEIQESGYQIVYICHCPEDRRFLKYLRGAKVDYELCDMSDWVPIKAFKFYNEIELMIGMRGHAQMIPFGLNCKIISLGTHDKMRWFLEDIEAVDWYVDLRSDPNKINDRITSIFNKIMTDEKDSEQRLLSAQSRLFEVTMRNMNNILNLLKENN